MPKRTTDQERNRRMEVINAEGLTEGAARSLGFSSVPSLRTWYYTNKRRTKQSRENNAPQGRTVRGPNRSGRPLSIVEAIQRDIQVVHQDHDLCLQAIQQLHQRFDEVQTQLALVVEAVWGPNPTKVARPQTLTAKGEWRRRNAS